MSFPSVFPTGTNNVGEFLANYMPNAYKLWQKGVKFANHHTTSSACSPARSVILTGLYSHQTWVTQTVKNVPGVKISEQPPLSPHFRLSASCCARPVTRPRISANGTCPIPQPTTALRPMGSTGRQIPIRPDRTCRERSGIYRTNSTTTSTSQTRPLLGFSTTAHRAARGA